MVIYIYIYTICVYLYIYNIYIYIYVIIDDHPKAIYPSCDRDCFLTIPKSELYAWGKTIVCQRESSFHDIIPLIVAGQAAPRGQSRAVLF